MGGPGITPSVWQATRLPRSCLKARLVADTLACRRLHCHEPGVGPPRLGTIIAGHIRAEPERSWDQVVVDSTLINLINLRSVHFELHRQTQ